MGISERNALVMQMRQLGNSKSFWSCGLFGNSQEIYTDVWVSSSILLHFRLKKSKNTINCNSQLAMTSEINDEVCRRKNLIYFHIVSFTWLFQCTLLFITINSNFQEINLKTLKHLLGFIYSMYTIRKITLTFDSFTV